MERLWKDGVNENGKDIVNWKIISFPMSKGGLGIGNLKGKNISLFTKWGMELHE